MDAPKTDDRFLSALLRNPSDDDIRSAIAAVASQFPSDAAVAAKLATILAASGERLSVDGAIVADVASTGGPASLSTLLAPLFLRAAGAIVPKLGVPGRPAGGIDCLAQIPGYRTEPPVPSATWALACSARRWNTRQNAMAPDWSLLTVGIRAAACVRSVTGKTKR